jgi:uncharacterized protein (DUF302 family)
MPTDTSATTPPEPGLTLRKALPLPYEQALAALPQALASEGFGVLTSIDVRDTLQRKLGVDFRRYTILGACNPTLAHQALEHTLSVGTLLPCNVVVYEADDHSSVVEAVDPMRSAGEHDPVLALLADTVRGKLKRVLDRL